MTNTIRTSAPGKVVLCGEYAVLDGAPAVCMAIERRARVTLRTIGGDSFEVTAPGFCDEPAYFGLSNDGVAWRADSDALAIVDAAWRTGLIEGDAAFSIDLDTTEFCDPNSGQKIGIGSSAALAVALCAALGNTNEVVASAVRLHADMQGGSGSGIDIACSLHGGLIEYRVDGFSVKRLHWPADLHYRLIWTGHSASTRRQLLKLENQDIKASRHRLGDTSEAIATTWRGGNARDILDSYADYIECLFAFSVDHDLGIFDAGHHDLWQAARKSGLIYKPCGAGGGDIGIVLSTDASSLDAFAGDLPGPLVVLDAGRSDTGLMT